MRKIIVLIVIILIVVAAAAIFLLPYLNESQLKQIAELEENIELLKQEQVPVRFTIKERTEETLLVAVKLYDADNKEIAKFENELVGVELSVDFYMVPVKERHLAFPYRIFTEQMAPDDGIMLASYYDNNGFPQVFYSEKNMNKDLKKGLSELFTAIKKGEPAFNAGEFGNLVHDIAHLKTFKVGSIYKVVTHTKGGIEVIEE